MKKILTLFLLVSFTLMSFSIEKEYNILISIKGMENKVGILAYYYGDKKYIKDTLQFNAKGIATIKGKKEIPAGVYLIAFPSMGFNSFDIILNEPTFSISTDTSNFIKNAIIKNSLENKIMFEDMKFMLPLGMQNDSLQKKLRLEKKGSDTYKKMVSSIEGISKKIIQHRKEIIKNNPSSFYTKLLWLMMETETPTPIKKADGSLVDSLFTFHSIQQHYFDKVDFQDSGIIRSPIFQHKLVNYFDNYVFPQPDSIIKAIDFVIKKAKVNREMYQFCLTELFTKYAKSEIMGQDAVYVDMAEKYYLNGGIWWSDEKNLTELRDRVEAIKPTLIGKMAPNFMVQDSSGKSYLFYDYVAKNKYTLLVFFNSDCGHCQKEIPHLKQLYNDSLRNLGLKVFAVSTEQTVKEFNAFVAKNCHSEWISCADMLGHSSFRKEYDIQATPKVYIVDKNYKIIAKGIPLENIYDFIKFQDNLLKKK